MNHLSYGLLVLLFSPVLVHTLARFLPRITLGWLPFLSPLGFFAITLYSYFASDALELKLWEPTSYFSIGFKLDLLSGILATSVTTIGVIVARFCVRYLQDDPKKDSFFRNLSWTLFTTIGMLLSPNLAMLFVFWFGTSYFLHQLLTHFADRRGAQQAALQKYAVSRFGDLLILSAGAVLLWTFKSLEFSQIFERLADPLFLSSNQGLITIASLLLVVGAMTKSAQFPFHFWLPNTMETPTPVSALMHAGIINAGGYLVLRMSPLLSTASSALLLLALVGGFTAFWATLTMLAQTNVKKALAYSTIAQMGFMMLQCGLGAFSMAVVHIVGHSFYKAYAFLSSGTATDYARLQRYFPQSLQQPGWLSLVWVGLASIILSFGAFLALGYEFQSRPGMWVLILILSLALAQVVLGSSQKTRALAISASMLVAYVVLSEFMRGILSEILPIQVMQDVGSLSFPIVLCALFFVVLYFVQNNLERISKTGLGKKLYVRALRGGI